MRTSKNKELIFLVFLFGLVSCSVVQKKGGGIHTSSSCYWDQNTDGALTLHFQAQILITHPSLLLSASTIYKWESKAILATISFFASFDSSLQ
jgi:hypothetical protein